MAAYAKELSSYGYQNKEQTNATDTRFSLPDFLPVLWLYIVALGIEFARFPTVNKKEYTLYIHLAI